LAYSLDVSLTFANKSVYAKWVRVFRASIYEEYFGHTIFATGSKV